MALHSSSMKVWQSPNSCYSLLLQPACCYSQPAVTASSELCRRAAGLLTYHQSLSKLRDAESKEMPRPHPPRRERRQQECAQEVARQEAQQRRAENLRQWMAALCQRHREEREARAAAAAEAAAAGLDGNQVGCDGSSLAGAGSSGSSASSDGGGADAVAVLQQYLVSAQQALPTPLCASLAGAPARPQLAQQHKAWHSAASRQAAPGQRGGKPGQTAGLEPACCGLSVTGVSAAAVAGCSDSARTSLAGTAQPTSSGGGGGKGAPLRRPLSAVAWGSRPEPVTVEAVIEQRQAAAAAGVADQGGLLPPASPRHQASMSGSAALAAWQAASRQQSTASETPAASGQPGRAAPAVAQPWQQAAWDAFGRPPGACPPPSSRFLDRVVTFVGVQQEAQLAVVAQLAQGDPDAASLSLCGGDGGFCSSGPLGDSAAGSLRSSGSGSGCPSGSGSGSGGITPELSSAAAALEHTHIPPAMLSALHTVRMTPRLPNGLSQPAPPAGAVLHRRAGQPGRQAARAQDAAAALAPLQDSSGSRVGQAAFALPSPPPGAHQPPAMLRRPPAARQPPEARYSPAKIQPSGGKCSPRAAAAACSGSPGRSVGPSKIPASGGSGAQLAYRQAIQHQAVKSVADLIAGMIREQTL